jgi:dihydrofolate reductase
VNDPPKYVATATELSVTWRNSTAIGPYDPATVRRLKEEVEGNIYVSGSGTLVRAMLADGLIDELHLFVYPIAVGSGPRLFEDGAPSCNLELRTCDAFTSGVVHLAYQPIAD